MRFLISVVALAVTLTSAAAQSDNYREIDSKSTCADGIGRTYTLTDLKTAEEAKTERSF